MGDMADYYLEQQMFDCLFEDHGEYEDEPWIDRFPYGFHRPKRKLTYQQRCELARQAEKDGSIREAGMRALTLEQVIARSKC